MQLEDFAPSTLSVILEVASHDVDRARWRPAYLTAGAGKLLQISRRSHGFYRDRKLCIVYSDRHLTHLSMTSGPTGSYCSMDADRIRRQYCTGFESFVVMGPILPVLPRTVVQGVPLFFVAVALAKLVNDLRIFARFEGGDPALQSQGPAKSDSRPS